MPKTLKSDDLLDDLESDLDGDLTPSPVPEPAPIVAAKSGTNAPSTKIDRLEADLADLRVRFAVLEGRVLGTGGGGRVGGWDISISKKEIIPAEYKRNGAVDREAVAAELDRQLAAGETVGVPGLLISRVMTA